MTIRFQADADFNQAIVDGVLQKEPSIDFQTANQTDLEGRPDEEVLAIAAQAGRLLVSHDRRTMPLHFAEFITIQTMPGLLIVPQNLSFQEAIETLVLIWAASNEEEWINRVVYLPL
jgi:Domain of unknown function (DUF5615)